MCGIAGYFAEVDRAVLKAMSATIRHRGPDGDDLYWDSRAPVGLAHRRLSIIDLSAAGNQPMSDASGSFWIVYNGEIYNFRKLRRDLELNGVIFKSRTDTEVILEMYKKTGTDLLRHLNGMYAFAIWDRVRQVIFLARDGFGIKPLYYCMPSAGQFFFASEIKALLNVPQLAREIDTQALAGHLTYLWSPAPATMLRSVRKLEPGCAMEIRGGDVVRRWRHYTLPFGHVEKRDAKATFGEELRSELSRAVDQQLVSDVPIGAFLSGGLDSSSIVAAVRSMRPNAEIPCFTVRQRDGAETEAGFDSDLPYARVVAKLLNASLTEVSVGPELFEDIAWMVYQLDEPQADFAALNTYLVCREARNQGIKVLLSGVGGDDIFGGYRRHLALRQERIWRRFPVSVRSMLAQFARSIPSRSVVGRRIHRAFAYADRPESSRLVSYFRWALPAITNGLLAPDIRRVVDAEGTDFLLGRTLSELPNQASPIDRMLYLDSRFFLGDHNLNYTDKMAMAVGVEVRVPLLDPELVKFAATLPDSLRVRGMQGKWAFKRAMENQLPKDVIWRPKTGFGVPLRSWMRGPLKDVVAEALAPKAISSRGLFDPSAITRLRTLDDVGVVDGSYLLLAIVCVEMWCRQFVDSRPNSTAA